MGVIAGILPDGTATLIVLSGREAAREVDAICAEGWGAEGWRDLGNRKRAVMVRPGRCPE